MLGIRDLKVVFSITCIFIQYWKLISRYSKTLRRLVMSLLSEQLHALAPTIKRICNISGTPGVSIGVAQKGQTIFKANFGSRDLEAQTAPDENTIFHIASMTKSFAAWAIASLVSEGKLKWDTLIVEILPAFKLKENTLTNKVDIVDLLAHRVGIAGGNAFWSQGENRNHIPKQEAVPIVGNLPQVMDFRDSFLYHNVGYSIITEIIEHLSGQSFGTCLTKNNSRILRTNAYSHNNNGAAT